MDEENLSAVVRLKPVVSTSTTNWKKVDSSVGSSDGKELYHLDKVFEQSTNKAIFAESVVPLMDAVLQGYNVAVLGYGASGSGKTHSLTGVPNGELGIVQEVFHHLMDRFKKDSKNKYRVHMSCLEIYCEKLRDLLLDNSPDLHILEKKGEPYIAGLTQLAISSREDFDIHLQKATDRREVGSTVLNSVSSRSHYIIRLVVESTSTEITAEVKSRSSIVHIVDLAGSENAAVAQTSGIRNLEGANINRSLLALTKCISILSEADKRKGANVHVPYRDSKLTRVLKPCLGGNSKTLVLCCISPDQQVESQSTLKFSRLVKTVKARPVKNEVSEDGDLAKYVKEINDLRRQLEAAEAKRVSGEDYKARCDKLAEMTKCIIEGEKDAPAQRKTNRRHSWAPGALQKNRKRSMSPIKKKGRLDFINESECKEEEFNFDGFGNDTSFGSTTALSPTSLFSPRSSDGLAKPLTDSRPSSARSFNATSAVDKTPMLRTKSLSSSFSKLHQREADPLQVALSKAEERITHLEAYQLLCDNNAVYDTLEAVISKIELKEEISALQNDAIRQKEEDLKMHAATVAKFQSDLSSVVDENWQLTKYKDIMQQREEELRVSVETVFNLQSELSSVRDENSQLINYRDLMLQKEEELKLSAENVSKLQSDLSSVLNENSMLSKYKEIIQEKEEELKVSADTVCKLQSELSSVRDENSQLINYKDLIQQKEEELKVSAETVCKLQSDLSSVLDDNSMLSKYKEIIQEKEEELKVSADTVCKLQSELSSVRDENSQLINYKDLIQQKEEELKVSAETVCKLQSDLSSVLDDNSMLSKYKEIIQEKEEELKVSAETVCKLQSDLSSVLDDNSMLSKYKEIIEQKEEELRMSTETVSKMRSELSSARDENSQLTKCKSMLLQKEEDLKMYAETVDKMESELTSVLDENSQLTKDKADLQKQISAMLQESVMGNRCEVASPVAVVTTGLNNKENVEMALKLGELDSAVQSQNTLINDLQRQVSEKNADILAKCERIKLLQSDLANEKQKALRIADTVRVLETRNHQVHAELRDAQENTMKYNIEKRQIGLLVEEEKKQRKHLESSAAKLLHDLQSSKEVVKQLENVKQQCATTIDSQKKTIMRLEVDVQMTKEDLDRARAATVIPNHEICEQKINALTVELEQLQNNVQMSEVNSEAILDRLNACETAAASLRLEKTELAASISVKEDELAKAKLVLAEQVKNEEMGRAYIRLKKTQLADARTEIRRLTQQLTEAAKSSTA